MNIRTQRLLLREFSMDDLDAVYAYESDPRISQYVCYGPYSREECSQQLAFHVEQQILQPRIFFHLALVLSDGWQLIGWCGLEVTEQDRREAELGYAIHPDYWRRGYTTEAAQAMIAFGFHDLQLYRIFATCHPQNNGSIRVLEKLGMQPEGYFRENKWCRTYWRDTCIFGLQVEEWQQSCQ